MIRPAAPEDHRAIRDLIIAAFGQSPEADLVEALRANGDVLVELVAEREGAVVGHILFSRAKGEDGRLFGALAPLSVSPPFQRQGLGLALMNAAHPQCAAAGADALIVLGSPAYYRRVGYSPEAAVALRTPYSGDFFMALALEPGALDRATQIAYPPAFARLDG